MILGFIYYVMHRPAAQSLVPTETEAATACAPHLNWDKISILDGEGGVFVIDKSDNEIKVAVDKNDFDGEQVSIDLDQASRLMELINQPLPKTFESSEIEMMPLFKFEVFTDGQVDCTVEFSQNLSNQDEIFFTRDNNSLKVYRISAEVVDEISSILYGQ